MNSKEKALINAKKSVSTHIGYYSRQEQDSGDYGYGLIALASVITLGTFAVFAESFENNELSPDAGGLFGLALGLLLGAAALFRVSGHSNRKGSEVDTALDFGDGIIVVQDPQTHRWSIISMHLGKVVLTDLRSVSKRDSSWDVFPDGHLQVVHEDNRSDIFSTEQNVGLIPSQYTVCGHLGDGYYAVAPVKGGDKQGVFSTTTMELIAEPERETWFRKSEADRRINPDLLAFRDGKYVGLHSISRKTMVVSPALKYERHEFELGGVRLDIHIGWARKGNGGRRRLWKSDVFHPETGEITIGRLETLSHTKDELPQIDPETGKVFVNRLGVKLVYPNGSPTELVKEG